jgi:flagellar hook-associated protein 1 FlgK
MRVNSALLANRDLIAAGRFDGAGARAVGDNSYALVLADLADAPVGPDNQTISDAYAQMVASMGLDAEQAETQATYYQGLVDQYSALQESISGVSLDEELSNLIKYQRGFQAAAKMVSTADEMLKTLLEIK